MLDGIDDMVLSYRKKVFIAAIAFVVGIAAGATLATYVF